MSDWKISGKGQTCAVCGRAFSAEEPFESAIFLAEDGEEAFERVDACPPCFPEVGREPYSRWLTRLPVGTDKKPLLDLGVAREFLVRLAREGNPERGNLMYILTLLLLRKRRVKLLGQRLEEDTTVMDILVPTEEEEGEEVTVPARDLAPEEAAELEEELNRLFG